MRSIIDNLHAQHGAAEHKVALSRAPLNYFVAAMLAGGFIGLADIFMMTAGGPLRFAESPWYPLVEGGVFGIGLILVVFAGGELVTSAMMILPLGVEGRRVGLAAALRPLVLMVLGNLAGAVLLSALVLGSGIMAEGTTPGRALAAIVAAKAHKTTLELFFRGVLCNVFVCLAIWSVGRASSEVARMVLMAWCMAAFVASGMEHVVANMTTFSLGLLHGVDHATLAEAARNLVTVFLGNLVGGSLLVALPMRVSAAGEARTSQ